MLRQKDILTHTTSCKSTTHCLIHTHTHTHCYLAPSLVETGQCLHCFLGFHRQQGTAGVLTISPRGPTAVCICVQALCASEPTAGKRGNSENVGRGGRIEGVELGRIAGGVLVCSCMVISIQEVMECDQGMIAVCCHNTSLSGSWSSSCS